MPICPVILAFESLAAGAIWFSPAPLVLKIALTLLLCINSWAVCCVVLDGGSSTLRRILHRVACYGSFVSVIAGCWAGYVWAGIPAYAIPLALVLIFDVGRNLPVKQSKAAE